MRSGISALEQPLTRPLVGSWLSGRPHWFSRHVECPVTALDPDGVWRGRLTEPTPRTGAVRVSAWARWLSTHLRTPVSMAAIMRTGVVLRMTDITDTDIRRLLDDVRAWRRYRMDVGPFTQPDSQDCFQVNLTHLLVRRATQR